MKLIGYLDGKKCFIRDEVEPSEAPCIATEYAAWARSQKQRLVLFVEDEGVTHMIQSMD